MDLKKQALQDFAKRLADIGKAAGNRINDLTKGKDIIDSASQDWQAARIDLQGQIENAWMLLLGTVPPPLGGLQPAAAAAGGGAPPAKADDRAKAGDRADAAMKFDAFLTQIGQAMAATQRHLDAESLTYLKEISRNRHALPTIFRIPKLSADMKFMLETEGGTTTNLIFFKQQNLARDLHQQSIHFELVSAPPPPEVMAAIQAAAPRMELVLDRAERNRVLAAASAAAAKDQLPADADSDRVVILGARAEQGYVVLYAAEKGLTTAVGVWLCTDIDLTSTAPSGVFRVIYSFDAANSRTEKFLRTFVRDLAAQQADFLGSA